MQAKCGPLIAFFKPLTPGVGNRWVPLSGMVPTWVRDQFTLLVHMDRFQKEQKAEYGARIVAPFWLQSFVGEKLKILARSVQSGSG